MEVDLLLNSFKLVKHGKNATDAPPSFMNRPAHVWPFTPPEGLTLAIQMQARYRSVITVESIGDTPIDLGRGIMEYDGSCLRLKLDYKHDGWTCETVYTKKM